MKFLTNHPKAKLFLQCSSLIGYIILVTLQCSRAIDRNLTTPSAFINQATIQLGLPGAANTIGFLYFLGSTIGLMLGYVFLQAIICLIKDLQNPDYQALFDELKGS